MKCPSIQTRAIFSAAVLCFAYVLRADAQTNAPAPATSPADSSEVLVLSPFVVDASEGSDSYSAKSTLAGTRVRTELKDVASAISVVTKQFMRDTGATDNASLLQYTTNTEVGGLLGNFSGNAGGLQFNEDGALRRPNSNTRVRGLDAADNTRDYFLTEIPWDSYNVDRVDLQRGPNSILFGVGSPAGIINTSVNGATFQNKNTIENRVAKFGSLRNSVDFNYVLIPKQLAVRVAALDDDTKYRQVPAFNHDKRLFGAVRYSPQFFAEGSNTSFRANYEHGKVNANRPRTLPPVDAISPWFYKGTDGNGNLMLNKFTYDASMVNPLNGPFTYENRGAYPAAWVANGAMGRQFWDDVVGFYGNNSDSTATRFMQSMGGSTRNGIGPNGAIDQGIGGLPVARPVSVASFSSYMIASGLPGGNNYADRTLSDPTIFDFYSKLIDGNNKYEWQKWDAANFAFSQTFLNDRVGFEAVYDYQRYSDGARVFLGNSDTYKIGVDMMAKYWDGTPNPDVGRAYVASSTERANNSTEVKRDGLRLTAYAELRADDFLDKSSRLAQVLGRHVFTGLANQDTKRVFNRSWATSAASPDYTAFTGQPSDISAHFRSYDFVSYISSNLSGLSSAYGAGLSSVNNIVSAPSTAMVRVFDNHWARSTVPGSPNYVDPAAPYSFYGLNSMLPFNPTNNGAPTLTTQSENPANYGGWKNIPVRMLNADNGDIDALTTGANRERNVYRAEGITWQGHMFNDHFVPVFGWRRDRIENANYSGAPDSVGSVSTNFSIPDSRKQFQVGESKSWGAVVHVPAAWTKMIPGKTTFSAFYNRSSNFKADAIRGDVFGNAIGNPIGRTKEYGVVVNTLDDRLMLKVTKYQTNVANATLSGSNPLGQNSYYLWAVPVWGTAFVANADQGIKGNNDNNAWAWNYAANDDASAPQFRNPDGSLNPAWQSHPSTVAEKAAINAWRQLPLEQSFFGAYGGEVKQMNVAAMRTGDWASADPLWSKKFDNQPGPGGTGFGTGTFTVDTLSKGYEIELIAQPTKNWNVSVNASKTFATREKLAPTIVQLMDKLTAFLDGPAGDIRLWGGGASNALRNQWKWNVRDPYNTFKSQEGSNAPEVAPWRFNAVSTYNFSEGRLQNSWIGGGYRWEDKRVLGYHFDPKIGVGGALDITKPWYSKSDQHFDLWVGHTRKLNKRYNWRGQINLRNVGESTKLVTVSINPDGTPAFQRIQEGMIWQLTNTLEF